MLTDTLLVNFHIENMKSKLKFAYISNFKYGKVGMMIHFNVLAPSSTEILLDSIPAPLDNFCTLLNKSTMI